MGADFDIAAVQKAMDEAAPGKTLTVQADIQQPEVTAADLKAVLFRDVLGEAKTQRETVSQQLQEQKKENSDLESDLSKADDKEFIKGLAKDQLGLAEDGERIFYDVNH